MATSQATGSVERQQGQAAPSISLPKGGGAIRGIGEKFAANPVTGTGSMSDGDEGWQPFRPFTERLNRETGDPNLRFVDLDGDGHADVLITEHDAWFAPSKLHKRALFIKGRTH